MNRFVYVVVLLALCAGGFLGWKQTKEQQQRRARAIESSEVPMPAPKAEEPPLRSEPEPPARTAESTELPPGTPAISPEVQLPVGVPLEISERNRSAIEALERGEHEVAIAGFEEC
ncbi:MAG: hypothetical protein AAF368_14220, partial [Planctomycetota bacterium]